LRDFPKIFRGKTMKFDCIKLKNYRQYRDAFVDFSRTTEDANFVVIIGTTGSGKTNLLNSITWCLYGIEYNIREKSKALPKINLTAFDEMKEDDSSSVSVEIHMTADENEKLIFRRELFFKKVNGKPVKIPDFNSKAPDKSTFTLIRQIGNDMVPVDSPEFILNRLIPQSIEEYFFFDGERLNDYFIDTSGEAIKNAVFKISQLGLLDNLIKHLSKRKDDRLRRMSKASPQTKEVQESLDVWKRSHERAIEDLSRLRIDRDKANKNAKKFSDKLRTSQTVDVKQLEEERLGKIENVKRLKGRIADLEKKKLQFLVESAPSIFMQKPLRYINELIIDMGKSGKIPPEFQKTFVEGLLRSGVCICGTDLTAHKNCRENLEKSLEDYDVVDELSIFLTRLEGTINNIKSKVGKFDDRRIDHGRSIHDLELERKKDSERVNQIKELIKGTNIKQIVYWETKLQEWEKAKTELDKQIAVIEYQMKEYEKRIGNLERVLEKELRKEHKQEQLAITHDFCKEALSVAKSVRDGIMAEIKQELEQKTEEQFFALSWKSSDYKDVKIDDEYNVSVIHQSGLEGIGTLSAGEGALLALAFMAALNNVSGFNVPIVIDTPLGRIAGLPRRNIAKKLPNYLPNKQVTMLMTDTEYSDEVRDLLSKRVGMTYQIEFVEAPNGGIAKVIPVEH